MNRGRSHAVALTVSGALVFATMTADAQHSHSRSHRRRHAPAAPAAPIEGTAEATTATSPQPAADVAAEARAHFDRGLTLLNTQNFEGAHAEFERSFALNPRPSVLYNLAVTLQALHRYPEAARSLEQYLREVPNLPPARRAEVEHVLEQLRALVAHVRIHVEPVGATIRIDGAPAGIAPLADAVPVGPGRHAVEVLVDGRTIAREEFTIASGDTRDLNIVPAPAATTATPVGVSIATGESADPRHTCSLTVRGTPPGATIEMDGRSVEANRAIEGGAGEHTLVVRAAGYATWRGSVGLSAGDHRALNVRLTETSGLSPAPFVAGLAGTVLLGGAAAVTGVLTMNTHARFETLYSDDPELAGVAAQGDALRNTTNALLVATGLVAAATVVLFTRTRFSSAVSTADVAVAPLPGGAAASVRLRF